METPKPIWVAEIIQPKSGSLGDNKPTYFFHCANPPAKPDTAKGITFGKPYLYSGNGFVSTDNPATAILLQQLLNDGSLTVKPFTTETQ